MINCPYCQTLLRDDAAFCPQCGGKIEQPAPQPTYEQPVYTQPAYEQPAPPPAYTQPMYEQATFIAPKKPSIALAIVSIVLGADAVIGAAIGAIYSFLLSFAGMADPELGFMGLFMALYFSIIVLPFGIVALVLGNKYLKGDPIRMVSVAKAGKITGLVSVILMVAAIGFGFLMMIATMVFAL